MTIGLCLIAIGKYDIFLQPLIDSVDKFFFRNDMITIYLFTDKQPISIHSDRINIVIIPTEHKPFPYPTLNRYKYITGVSDKIVCDYLFYSDVDMRFVAPVDKEILSDLTATLHPGFYKGGGSWETRIASTAHMTPQFCKKYYAGGFQGGERNNYLKACKEMAENIAIDENNGVIAVWHDESHWNKYIHGHKHKELSPSYCYPESWNLPFQKKLLALDKNHADIRK